MIPQALPQSGPCTSQHFELIKDYIREFELDDRALFQKDFFTISRNNVLMGFARVRRYASFSEVCSLGVITSERLKGIGKRLMRDLLSATKEPLYLVCVIPSFFESLGFIICNEFPEEIRMKLEYCSNSLHTDQPYVVMKRS